MYDSRIVDEAVEQLSGADTLNAIAVVLETASFRMGYRYFALGHHLTAGKRRNIQLSNYPCNWATFHRSRITVSSDPITRAAERCCTAFSWRDLVSSGRLDLPSLTTIELGSRAGVYDGITVPAHIPGEPPASCSFATPARQDALRDLGSLQLIGAFAFEHARRVERDREHTDSNNVLLTPRQTECILWVARGKTDWETARILALSTDTVTQHLKQARERLGVSCRTSLVVQALATGDINIADVSGPIDAISTRAKLSRTRQSGKQAL